MKNKINKTAQLKIQQMAFMLVALTIFFALVALFVVSLKFSSIRERATSLEEENALLLVTKLANSPEFSCGESFDTIRGGNCIDADKVMMLKDRGNYAGFWQVAEIQIRKIYPAESSNLDDDEIECSLSNYPNCNLIKAYSKNVNNLNKGPFVSNFVTLCHKELLSQESYDKCEIAKLLISYEIKE